MKIVPVIFLIFILLIHSAAFAATEKASAEEMLRLIKDRIGSTDEYDTVSADSRTDEDGTVYNFSWSYSAEGESRNMYVTAKESGIITGFDKYDSGSSYREKPSINRLSESELTEKAQAFTDKLNPSLVGKLKVEALENTERLSDENRYFTVQRYENGIPVLGDSGSVSVNSEGEVMNFWLSYTENIAFEAAGSLIDKSAAEKAYTENFGFELCYIKKWDEASDSHHKNVLVWQPKDRQRDEYISAVTGDVVERILPDYENYGGMYRNTKAEMSADEAGGGKSAFTEAELKALDTVAGLISPNDIESKIRKIKLLKLSDKMKLKSINMHNDEYDEMAYIYNMQFSDGKSYAYASVNAETGELLSFDRYSEGGVESGRLDTKKLKKLADSALKSLAPTYFPSAGEENAFRFSEEASSDGFLHYDRYVNGIRCDSDYININFDTKGNSIVYFTLRRSKDEFPSPEGALAFEEAAEKIFKSASFEPVYMLTCSKEGLNNYDKAFAVYYLDGDKVIDAFTGKTDREEEGAQAEYTDLSGHYAETAALALRRYSVGYAGESFKPSEKITQKDFLVFLQSVFEGYGGGLISENYSYDSAYRFAYYRNMITREERDPDAALTREQAAALMIAALGFKEVAEIDEIYKPIFNDVTSNIGSISILAGMKVIGGDGNGNFNPNGLLTRGDAAVILYNYLSR